MKSRLLLTACTVVTAGALILAGCSQDGPEPGAVLDEALEAGRTAESFPAADEDYFHDMDGGNREGAPPLSENAVRGRNTWIVWTGGNDLFWDFMSNNTFGAFDLLKTLSSHPNQVYSRDNRWHYLGLVNEPCFEKATGPDPERWGLWLDRRVEGPDCPPDPFADAEKYPGVKIGARGTIVDSSANKELPVGSYYGEPSGIVGLRLFSNPAFDEDAAAEWDAERYYTDPEYYQRKDLVRPYRVGMSCAFCHVGPSPTNPPEDPENPGWEHLNSNPGAQYYWVNRVFFWDTEPRQKPDEPAPQEHNFIYQLFHTNPPGTLDTSLVSTDYINNPRTMNAVYSIGPRLEVARRWGRETLAGGELNNKQFNDYPETAAFAEYFEAPNTVWTPRVLKDGADSVGALGALNRVYINIGLFSEEWLLHFRPVIGGKKITPIRIEDAQKNSTYWNATEAQTADMAIFFVETAKPDKLADVRGGVGRKDLSEDEAVLERGKIAFAENCAACHSSKIPEAPPDQEIDTGKCAGGGNGPQYLECWNNYWAWAQTQDFKDKMRALVLQPDFLENNSLSTERRIPVTLLETNACSPLATNAIENDIWDNFSSQSYKQLPSVGTITVHHPVTGEGRPYEMPGGGLGYTRPPSLISVWSTAPFLLNNSVGRFYNYSAGKQGQYESGAYGGEAEYGAAGSLHDARIRSFNDSIEKMLWPEKRKKDPVLGDKVPGYIYRTTAASCLRVPAGYLPEALQELTDRGFVNRMLARFLPWLAGEGSGLEIGPIPDGTPVNLLANVQLIPEGDASLIAHGKKVVDLLKPLIASLKEIGGGCSAEDLRDPEKIERARQIFLESGVVDRFIELSKCPDYVVNRGHYFGTDLADGDKRALIEYLKTF